MKLLGTPKSQTDSQCMQAVLDDIANAAIPTASKTTSNTARVDIDDKQVANGLAQLVLTVVRLVHELLERQAIRRMDAGSLTDEEIERLGSTLQAQAKQITETAAQFGLTEDDLNLDLGPLGKAL